MTPASVHYGYAPAVVEQRNQTLQAAYEAHPERFPKGLPMAAEPPTEAWINPPKIVLSLPEQPSKAR